MAYIRDPPKDYLRDTTGMEVTYLQRRGQKTTTFARTCKSGKNRETTPTPLPRKITNKYKHPAQSHRPSQNLLFLRRQLRLPVLQIAMTPGYHQHASSRGTNARQLFNKPERRYRHKAKLFSRELLRHSWRAKADPAAKENCNVLLQLRQAPDVGVVEAHRPK